MLVVTVSLCAFAIVSVARTIPQDDQEGMDTVTRGPYTILNCGTINATKITNSLDNLAKYLAPAIQDAEKSSTTPSPAYTTFFKDRTSASYVSTLLTNVTTGPAMYSPNHYSNGAPIFACVQNVSQVVYTDASTNTKTDAYHTCKQNATLASYIVSGTPYIIVCPSFFAAQSTLPIQPSVYPAAVPAPRPGVAASNCLALDAAGTRFSKDGSLLTEFMPWLLLEEIAHYYISTCGTNTDTVRTVETYEINRCAALDAERSVQNAHNLVYYVANVYAQCTSFPTNSTTTTPQQGQGREILATTPPPQQGKAPTGNTYPAGVLDGMTDVLIGGYGDLEVVSVHSLTYTTTSSR